MGHKVFMGMMVFFLIAGCASIQNKEKAIYVNGYREGIKQQAKQLAQLTQGAQTPFYHWIEPIVQELTIPAHIANGVFIPQHQELVIIKPGEWKLDPSYPIQRKGDNHEKNIQLNYGVVAADITDLPKSTQLPNDFR